MRKPKLRIRVEIDTVEENRFLFKYEIRSKSKLLAQGQDRLDKIFCIFDKLITEEIQK